MRNFLVAVCVLILSCLAVPAWAAEVPPLYSWCTGDSPLAGRPYDVAVGPGGDLFVLGFTHIQRFSPAGALITEWGSGEFHAYQLDVDNDGHVYVADDSNNRVLKYDTVGNLLTQWGTTVLHGRRVHFLVPGHACGMGSRPR